VAAVAFVAYGSLLLGDGLPVRNAEAAPATDAAFALQSARGFAAALDEGVLYPRWIADANHGYGAPTFVYYPPLAYYLAGGATLGLGGAVDGLRVTAFLLALASGLAFLWSFRHRLGTAPAALGAALYVAMPYHLIDAYWRFALAELASFVWLPPLVHFAARTAERPGRGPWVGLTVCAAALMLTHLITAYLAALVVVPYALARVASAGRWRHVGALATAAAAALLVSAIYWAPVLAERDAVRLEWTRTLPHFQIDRNFVYRDETAHGYGKAPIKPWVNVSATAQALLALVAAGWAVSAAPRRRGDVLALAGLAAWTLLLQTPLSAPLWRALPELDLAQFPWRFGGLQALLAALLAAHALAGAPPRRRGVLAAGLLAASVPALAASLGIQAAAQERLDEGVAARESVRGRPVYEYMPAGIADWRGVAASRPRAADRARLEGPGEVEVVHWGTHERRIRVRTSRASRLRVRTFVHPGWRARVGGAPVPIAASNPRRAIEVPVPPGRHEVELVFGQTAARRGAAVASALGVALLLGVGLGPGAGRPRRQGRPGAGGDPEAGGS